MKKGVVTAVIILFICVAVYLNMNTENIESDGERLKETIGESIIPTEGDYEEAEENAEENITEKSEAADGQEGNALEYFEKARIEKQKARDTAITTLKEAVSEENLSQSSRDSAAQSIETISTSAISESRIETLVKAKGYTDCIALINDAGVNVIVTAPAEGLTASDTTKIKDIAVSETSFSPSHIKIIEIK